MVENCVVFPLILPFLWQILGSKHGIWNKTYFAVYVFWLFYHNSYIEHVQLKHQKSVHGHMVIIW